MLYGNKPYYEDCCRLKKGMRKLSVPFEYLRARLSERFGINVLNVGYEVIDDLSGGGRPRLDMVVDSAADFARIHRNRFELKPDVQEGIHQEFREMLASYGLERDYPEDGLLFACDDFSDESLNQAVFTFLEKDREDLVRDFSADGVWKIEAMSKALVVFFLDENARQVAALNGVGQRIREQCYLAVKRHDEFGYLLPENFVLSFDSKEILDRSYEGSLFNYFR